MFSIVADDDSSFFKFEMENVVNRQFTVAASTMQINRNNEFVDWERNSVHLFRTNECLSILTIYLYSEMKCCFSIEAGKIVPAFNFFVSFVAPGKCSRTSAPAILPNRLLICNLNRQHLNFTSTNHNPQITIVVMLTWLLMSSPYNLPFLDIIFARAYSGRGSSSSESCNNCEHVKLFLLIERQTEWIIIIY